MLKKIIYLSFIAIIILNCNSKSDTENLKLQNKEQEIISSLSTIIVDIDSSSINWIGKKVMSSHEGIINISSGELVMSGDKLISGIIEVDMNSIINTDIEKIGKREYLTNHLKNEDFFNVLEYSKSTLIITNSEQIDEANYTFNGDLTIKGITHPVDFKGTVEKENDNYCSHINLEFDRTLWNIKYNSGQFFENLGDKLILDNIELNIVIKTK
jgi:polyisoprenoid-binding protein YceI